jgi:hypothetical protein
MDWDVNRLVRAHMQLYECLAENVDTIRKKYWMMRSQELERTLDAAREAS